MKFKILLFLVLLICSVGLSSATDYYVSTIGDNSNDGLSVATPKQNFSSIDWFNSTNVKPGDTIYLINGTWHNETMWLTDIAGNHVYITGNTTHVISIKAYNGTPTLDGHNDNNYAMYGYNNIQSINVSGITFNNYGSSFYIRSAENIHISNNIMFNRGTINLIDTSDSSILNNDIDGSTWNSMQIQSNYRNVTNIIVSNNKIHNNTYHNLIDLKHAGAKPYRISDISITGNELYGAPTYYCFGVHVADGNSVQYFDNITFSNNIIHDIDGTNNIGIEYLRNSKIENNTIYDCTSGFSCSGSSYAKTGVTFTNNTVYSTTYPVDFYNSGIEYNFYCNNISKYKTNSGTFIIHNTTAPTSFQIISANSGIIYLQNFNNIVFSENGANTSHYYQDCSKYITQGDETVTIVTRTMQAKPDTNSSTTVINKFNVSEPVGNIAINFTANSTNGTQVDFIIWDLFTNHDYQIKKDGTQFQNVTSNSTGHISFSNSEWSEKTFTIQDLGYNESQFTPNAVPYLGKRFNTYQSGNITHLDTVVSTDTKLDFFMMVII